MSDNLLTKIENDPSDALVLFIDALKDFKTNFTFTPDMTIINLPILARERVNEKLYRIVNFVADDIETKIAQAIRNEISQNLFGFQAFLTKKIARKHKIICNLPDCFVTVEIMGKEYHQQTNEFELTISKRRGEADGFSGFYITDFAPVIPLDQFLDDASKILCDTENEDETHIYVNAACLFLAHSIEYSRNSFTYEKGEELLSDLISSIQSKCMTRTKDCESFERLSYLLKTTIQASLRYFNNVEQAESLLKTLTEYNLKTYFSFVSPSKDAADIFFMNSLTIANNYQNKPSVIQLAIKSFKFMDEIAKSHITHIRLLQEAMLQTLDESMHYEPHYLDFSVAILEFMLHWVVILTPNWSTYAIDFINKQLKLHEESSLLLYKFSHNFETRLVMFNKNCSHKSNELKLFEKKLSHFNLSLEEKLEKEGEDYNLNHRYPIDINGNFFKMVTEKDPYIKVN